MVKPQCLRGVARRELTAVWILIGVLIAGKRGQGGACEICVWKAQKEQKDLVIFLKSSVTTSYDL